MLITGFLVMFMQTGFAMVETGFTRAKNAAHTFSMNFMVYPIGMFGYWVCGFALQMGGIAPRRRARRRRAAEPGGRLHAVRQDLRALRHEGLLPRRRRLRRRRLRAVPVPDGVHGHGGDDPDGRHGRALEVVVVPRLRVLHVDVRLPALRQLGVGRRLARRPRRELRPRPRPRGLRRLLGRAHGRRRRGARRRDRARAAPRQVRQERQAGRDPRPPHPDGDRRAR